MSGCVCRPIAAVQSGISPCAQIGTTLINGGSSATQALVRCGLHGDHCLANGSELCMAVCFALRSGERRLVPDRRG